MIEEQQYSHWAELSKQSHRNSDEMTAKILAQTTWLCQQEKNRTQTVELDGCMCCCSGCLAIVLGFLGAGCLSWIFNHSVLWMIVHSVLGWIYLAYKAVWYVMTHF